MIDVTESWGLCSAWWAGRGAAPWAGQCPCCHDSRTLTDPAYRRLPVVHGPWPSPLACF